MQYKVILGILVVLVLVTGGIFLFNSREMSLDEGGANPESMVDVSGAPVESYAVAYTTDGFSPDVVEVQQGGTVVFVNESESPMWVASAIHPTHSLYPQKSDNDCLGSSFDACAPIAQDASWSFAFTEVGSWKYHDHLKANHGGTVVVK
ncbi:MAG: hypothetical protein Q8R36_02570 [bacterium]|nr:hypothetical protein [bacterium]